MACRKGRRKGWKSAGPVWVIQFFFARRRRGCESWVQGRTAVVMVMDYGKSGDGRRVGRGIIFIVGWEPSWAKSLGRWCSSAIRRRDSSPHILATHASAGEGVPFFLRLVRGSSEVLGLTARLPQAAHGYVPRYVPLIMGCCLPKTQSRCVPAARRGLAQPSRGSKSYR
jgi:hypothetical protein